MSKTVLADVSGFTPIIDDLARELGHTTAAVFGVVWRHCQLRDGVCRASLATISDYIGIDRSTVSRHLEVLTEHGYLQDLTPELRGKPHIYADTGKAGIKITVESTVAQRNSFKPDGPTVAKSSSAVAQRNSTVANYSISKVVKKQNNKQGDINPSLSIGIDGNGRTPLSLWPAILAELRLRMSKTTYQHFSRAQLHAYDPQAQRLYLDAPCDGEVAPLWAQQSTGIERIIQAMTGVRVQVEWLPAGE